ncbi:hypothetical protein FHS10_000723 [Mucilaginibacter dorajii]|nr:hypothetical protein [Mucilaginibacter dorajii]
MFFIIFIAPNFIMMNNLPLGRTHTVLYLYAISTPSLFLFIHIVNYLNN